MYLRLLYIEFNVFSMYIGFMMYSFHRKNKSFRGTSKAKNIIIIIEKKVLIKQALGKWNNLLQEENINGRDEEERKNSISISNRALEWFHIRRKVIQPK